MKTTLFLFSTLLLSLPASAVSISPDNYESFLGEDAFSFEVGAEDVARELKTETGVNHGNCHKNQLLVSPSRKIIPAKQKQVIRAFFTGSRKAACQFVIYVKAPRLQQAQPSAQTGKSISSDLGHGIIVVTQPTQIKVTSQILYQDGKLAIVSTGNAMDSLDEIIIDSIKFQPRWRLRMNQAETFELPAIPLKSLKIKLRFQGWKTLL